MKVHEDELLVRDELRQALEALLAGDDVDVAHVLDYDRHPLVWLQQVLPHVAFLVIFEGRDHKHLVVVREVVVLEEGDVHRLNLLVNFTVFSEGLRTVAALESNVS